MRARARGIATACEDQPGPAHFRHLREHPNHDRLVVVETHKLGQRRHVVQKQGAVVAVVVVVVFLVVVVVVVVVAVHVAVVVVPLLLMVRVLVLATRAGERVVGCGGGFDGRRLLVAVAAGPLSHEAARDALEAPLTP